MPQAVLKAKTERLVAAFVEQIVTLAEHAAYEMVIRALEGQGGTGPVKLSQAVDEFERQLIRRALQDNDGNVAHAAQALDVARQSLQRKIRRLALKDELSGTRSRRGVASRS